MLKGFENLTADRFFAYIIFLLSAVIPGLGIIFFFNYKLFLDLDSLKLLLLSVLYSLPLVVASLFGSIDTLGNIKIRSDDEAFLILLLQSSLINITSFFTSLVFTKLLEWAFDIKLDYYFMYSLWFVFIHIALFVINKSNTNKKISPATS